MNATRGYLGRLDAPPGWGTAALAGLVAAALTVASYLVWLGWHEPRHLEPGTSNYVGPNTPFQIIGIAITLALVVSVGAWLRVSWSVMPAVAIAITVIFAADAATQHEEDASLWPIGAVMVFVAAAAGSAILAVLVEQLRQAMARRARS